MATYDSDSSEDETGSFVTTDVLLGYASKEPTEDEISQLGGTPEPPHGSLTACLVCNERMPLLLQLHADLPDRFPGHGRRLHVFACRRKACRRRDGSVRAIRSTQVVGDPSIASGVATAADKTTATTSSARSEKEDEDYEKIEKPSTSVSTTQQQQQAPKTPAFLGSSIFGGAKPPSSSARNPFATGGGDGGDGGAPGEAVAAPSPFSLSSVSELASKPAQKPSTGPSSTAASDDLPATFAAKVKLGNDTSSPSSSSTKLGSGSKAPTPALTRKEPGPQQPAYPSYFLDADYEALGSGPPAPAQNARVVEVGAAEDDNEGAGGSSSRAMADDLASESAHDKTFQRFADRLWHNPEQVLRYEVGGAPLLYSRTDAVGKLLAAGAQGQESSTKVKTTAARTGISTGTKGIPPCANCAAPRLFECQITPHAIVELEADDDALDGMEWGTIIVGVCSRDCMEKGVETGKVGYLDEWAGVQWEERNK